MEGPGSPGDRMSDNEIIEAMIPGKNTVSIYFSFVSPAGKEFIGASLVEGVVERIIGYFGKRTVGFSVNGKSIKIE